MDVASCSGFLAKMNIGGVNLRNSDHMFSTSCFSTRSPTSVSYHSSNKSQVDNGTPRPLSLSCSGPNNIEKDILRQYPHKRKTVGKTSVSYHSSKESQVDNGTPRPLSLSCSGPNNIEKDILRQYPHKRKTVGKTFFSPGVCIYDNGIAVESYSHGVEEKVGVLLLNLGGPETLNDVQPFLVNIFADPDIMFLPRVFRFLQRPLAELISVLRAPKSKEGYAAIGGGSPLRKVTDEQAHAIKMALESKNISANVYVGMRHWYPFTEEAIHYIKRDRITRLVVLPLYPQFSISTTGSSIRVIKRIFRNDAHLSRLPVAVIKSWYQREGYIKSMADLITKELETFSEPTEVMIFFSAHGVPVSYVEDARDPYKDQMEECIYFIMQELKSRGINNKHTLAYQSRVGPVQWLKPYTGEVLVELGQNGVKSLLAVPISFVSEHKETLEEIDMEYKHLALKSGIENWGRVPALGCTSSFITDLADAVIEALPLATAMSTSLSPSEELEHDPV